GCGSTISLSCAIEHRDRQRGRSAPDHCNRDSILFRRKRKREMDQGCPSDKIDWQEDSLPGLQPNEPGRPNHRRQTKIRRRTVPDLALVETQDGVIGLAATWNALPRTPLIAHATHSFYVDAVREF